MGQAEPKSFLSLSLFSVKGHSTLCPSSNLSLLPTRSVRTLFVSGLPVDIKPRELYLLFRPFKGYEGSLIKLTSKQVNRSGAEAAKNALNVSNRWSVSKLK
uniref:RNA binding protein, mRNA processing factor 2a n=1 Tax=Sinocyclocheilus grahami TaxID=75366 RepID=A0A672KIN1_SINGR